MNFLENMDYENHTYEELSYEFQQLYPSAFRAFQLIPLMYNRLTLIDKILHSEAIRTIYVDHMHLEGFSRRNIYRFLPSDNPNIPRRGVPSRHKPTSTKLDTILESNTKRDASRSQTSTQVSDCNSSDELRQINKELEKALEESSRPIVAANFTSNIKKYGIPKERHIELLEAIKESKEFVYLEFNNRNMFISAIADTADFYMSEN